MGVRKGLMEEGNEIDVGTESVMVGETIQGKSKWRIIGVYADRGIENVIRKVESWIDKKAGDIKLLIGGDFNARIGSEEEGYEEEGERRERRAKDGIINGEGRKLVEWVEENGWSILNECTKGEEEREFFHRGERKFNDRSGDGGGSGKGGSGEYEDWG